MSARRLLPPPPPAAPKEAPLLRRSHQARRAFRTELALVRAAPALVAVLLSSSLVAPSPAAAAQKAKLTLRAHLDRSLVTLGDEVELIVEASGAYEALEGPDAPDFTVLAQARRTRVRLSGGKTQRYYEASWLLRPRRVGTLTVGPVRARLAGAVAATTQPLTVQVANAGPARPAAAVLDLSQYAGRRMFALGRPSVAKPFAGQAFAVTWSLYYDPDAFVTPQGIDVPPRLEGLVDLGPLGLEDRTATKVRVGDRDLIRVPYLRLLVVAQHPGQATVHELVIDGVVDGRYPHVRLRAPAFTVAVAPLPDPEPDYFRAAHVGTFTLSTTTRVRDQPVPAQLNDGDVITMDITVRGEGLLDVLDRPILDGADRFEVTVQAAPIASYKRTPRGLLGSRTFRYSLRPRELGTYVLPTVHFTSFDPERRAYRSLSVPGRPITVGRTMTPLMGGATLGTRSARAARAEVGWPGLKLTYVMGAGPDLDISPQVNVIYGRHLRSDTLGFEPGAEIRWTLLEDGPYTLALLAEPALVFWVPTAGGSGRMGLRWPIPGLVGGWQVSGTMSLFAGLRAPLEMTFEKPSEVFWPILIDAGLEAEVYRAGETLVNVLGRLTGGPALCLAHCRQGVDGVLQLSVGAAVVW